MRVIATLAFLFAFVTGATAPGHCSSSENRTKNGIDTALSNIVASGLRTQLTIAPNFFSKLTKLKTKFGISCSKEWVNTILKSIYHPVLCISYLVFALVFLENLTFGVQFGSV